MGIADQLRALGVRVPAGVGSHRTTCPACSPHRKKKRDPCLAVTVTADEALLCCHHCQFKKRITHADRPDDSPTRKPQHQRRDRRQAWLAQFK